MKHSTPLSEQEWNKALQHAPPLKRKAGHLLPRLLSVTSFIATDGAIITSELKQECRDILKIMEQG